MTTRCFAAQRVSLAAMLLLASAGCGTTRQQKISGGTAALLAGVGVSLASGIIGGVAVASSEDPVPGAVVASVGAIAGSVLWITGLVSILQGSAMPVEEARPTRVYAPPRSRAYWAAPADPDCVPRCRVLPGEDQVKASAKIEGYLTVHGLRRTSTALIREVGGREVAKAIAGHVTDRMHAHYSGGPSLAEKARATEAVGLRLIKSGSKSGSDTESMPEALRGSGAVG